PGPRVVKNRLRVLGLFAVLLVLGATSGLASTGPFDERERSSPVVDAMAPSRLSGPAWPNRSKRCAESRRTSFILSVGVQAYLFVVEIALDFTNRFVADHAPVAQIDQGPAFRPDQFQADTRRRFGRSAARASFTVFFQVRLGMPGTV